MAWVPAAIAVGGSLLGSMMSDSDSKAGGAPTYAMQTMPSWLQDKFTASMAGMPSGINIGFGGQNYPSTYGPLMRSATKLYQPGGVIPYQQNTSALTGAMTAAAPWAWMGANQANSFNNTMPYNFSTYEMNSFPQPTWGVNGFD